MHAFSFLPKLNTLQHGLSAITDLLVFIQVLSYCYWTECPPLTLLIRRLPILNARRALYFSTAYSYTSLATFNRMRSKFFDRSARELIPTLISKC